MATNISNNLRLFTAAEVESILIGPGLLFLHYQSILLNYTSVIHRKRHLLFTKWKT